MNKFLYILTSEEKLESKWYGQVDVKWKVKQDQIGIGLLKEWKEVKWAWSTMGEWDLTLWVDADGPEALESFVSEKLKDCNWIEKTKSSWAKKSLIGTNQTSLNLVYF